MTREQFVEKCQQGSKLRQVLAAATWFAVPFGFLCAFGVDPVVAARVAVGTSFVAGVGGSLVVCIGVVTLSCLHAMFTDQAALEREVDLDAVRDRHAH